jgi:hypothetical protein
MRKAQYFSVDAIISTVVMLLGLLLALSIHVKEPEAASVEQYSQDVMNIISSVKLSEINSSYITELYNSGQIDDLNRTLLEEAGFFWAANKTDIAEKLLNVTQDIIPAHIHLSVFIGDEIVFGSMYTEQPSTLISSKRMISGIQKDKPVRGFSTQVQLSSFDWRTSYSYYYFGGFVGQGNITVRLVLPDNIINISSAYLELDSSNNFTLSVNGRQISNFSKGSGGGSYRHADKWFLSNSSLGNFTRGVNNISLNFSGLTSYIGGGFIRVGYKTSDINDSLVVFSGDTAMQRYYFPQVRGLPNIFDSFFVPGHLEALTAYLHYNSSYPSFLTIGNTTVWSNQTNFTQYIQLSNGYLSARLDYDALSESTIPLRFGIIGMNETLPGQGPVTADVMLVNDYSGSMEYCAVQQCDLRSNDNQAYCGTSRTYTRQRSNPAKNCNWTTENFALPGDGNVCAERWHVTCPAGDVRKIDVLKNATRAFATSMLTNNSNGTSSRMGMVGYSSSHDDVIPQGQGWNQRFTAFSDSIVLSQNLTSNLTIVNNSINTNMDAWWGTCICCGVKRAVQIINAMGNQSRRKAIVVMSDGQATEDCGNSSAKTDAINEAEKACTNNISVSTVAFGADADPATLQSMVCGGGAFYNATNVSNLIAAYTSIADSMKTSAYAEEVVNVTGGIGEGILYGDSYLQYNYTPNVVNYGMIPAILESPRFGNNLSDTTLNLLPDIVLSEVRVTSYSAELWTDNLTVSNSIPNRNAFSMKNLANNYTAIGDPFVVYASPSLFQTGNNLVHISTATSQKTYSGGSSDDMIIYKILIPNMAGEGGVFAKADGCRWWNITFSDNTSIILGIPSGYAGGEVCSYNPPRYDASDAVDDAVYQLLGNLDIDGDGKLDVKFSEDSLDVKSFTISGVPSLWGPAVAEVRAWQ